MTQTTQTLECKVLEYLKTKYELEYVKEITYNTEDTYHELIWELNNKEYPYKMMGDFVSQDDFFNYICKQIDSSRFFLKDYFILKMETAPDKTTNK